MIFRVQDFFSSDKDAAAGAAAAASDASAACIHDEVLGGRFAPPYKYMIKYMQQKKHQKQQQKQQQQLQQQLQQQHLCQFHFNFDQICFLSLFSKIQVVR